MKRISLLILLAITAANTCRAMANNAKINPALAASANKLQAKPILFFNTERLYCVMDYQTGDLKTASISDEMNYTEAKIHKGEQEYQAKYKVINDKQVEATNQYNKQKISADAYSDECRKISAERQQVDTERNANINKLREQQQDVPKKIAIIAESIAKRLGACGAANYNPAHYKMMGQIPTITCVDPAYDITNELFDILNKEYKASKDEKPSCNHCTFHCPHNSKNK